MYQQPQPQPNYQYVNPGTGNPTGPSPYQVQPGQDPNQIYMGEPIQPQPGTYQPQPAPYQPGGGMMVVETYQVQNQGYSQPVQGVSAGPNTQMQCIGQTNPVSVHCPNCDKQQMTKVKCEMGQKIWFFSLMLCILVLFGCPPCCCIPCYYPSCYEYKHHCNVCGTYAGSSMTGTLNQGGYY